MVNGQVLTPRWGLARILLFARAVLHLRPRLVCLAFAAVLLSPALAHGGDAEVAETRVRTSRAPWSVRLQLDAFGGVLREPTGSWAVPLAGFVTFHTHTSRRHVGFVTRFGPEGQLPDGGVGFHLQGMEFYARNLGGRLDLRVGRLSVVHGGRFRFVDGGLAKLRLLDLLELGVWGGMSWHPERLSPFSGGPVVGAELALRRSALPVAGRVRYERLIGEDGVPVDRIGGDATLHLPRAAGLVAEARVDAAPVHEVLELVALAGELRPHYRVHMRLELGRAEPRVDEVGAGGAIYPILQPGPTLYAEGRLRLTAPFGAVTLDGGFVGSLDEGELRPGGRATVGLSSHPGKPWRHVVRVMFLHGHPGTAFVVLAEVGRQIGWFDFELLAEQAVFQYSGRVWRGATHVGVQTSLVPSDRFRLSLTAEVDLGRIKQPDALVLLWATFRWDRGRVGGPSPQPDRFLSPWSPYRWTRKEMPRTPGTVPGADPYPSIPQGAEQ